MRKNGKVGKSLYMARVREVQDECAKRMIHDGLSVSEIKGHIDRNVATPIARNTIKRFVQYGRGSGRMVYVRGPASPTLFAIVEGIGFELVLRRVKNS